MRTPGDRKSYVTQGEVLLEIPCADIDQVMLFGNVQVTTQALQELLQHGIEFAIFTRSGKLIGQLTPPKTKNIFLRMDQFQRQQDAQFCLDVSKRFVIRKIESMLSIVTKHHKYNPNSFSLNEINQLEKFITQANKVESNNSLLGIEGSATALYFQFFSRMLNPPWKFAGRNRRPPKDPVNAVLSFGYVIVGSEIQSLLDGIGFDPYLGFYHVVEYGRPSLALDVLEEYRHELVDRLALNLFNLGIFKKPDFDQLPKGGVYLGTEGKKKFFAQYEKIMGQYAGDTDTIEKKYGFRKQIQDRIAELAKTIRSERYPVTVNEPVEEDFDVD